MTKVRFDQIAKEVRNTFSGDKAGVPIVGLEHIIPNELLLSDHDIDTENTFTKAFKRIRQKELTDNYTCSCNNAVK